MPTRLAARKCPSSCTNTRTPRTKPNESRVINVPDTYKTSDFQFYRAGNRLCTLPGRAIDLPHLLDGSHFRRLMGAHRLLDDLCNRGKRQATCEKKCHSHFIGGVEHDWQ